MSDHSFINSSVTFVYTDDTVESAVRLMNEKNISSCMVIDRTDHLVGIITERDIVRKFTLLSVDDKLDRQTNTIMTRPVRFVNIDNMYEEIDFLHRTTQIRHFPILSGPKKVKKNLVGMITPTDLFRQHLTQLKKEGYLIGSEIFILANKEQDQKNYKDIFSVLGYKTIIGKVRDAKKFVQDNLESTIIIDIDDSTVVEISDCLKDIKYHKGQLFLMTSDAQLVAPFRQRLDSSRQHIAVKPLDVSYINWLIGARAASDE